MKAFVLSDSHGSDTNLREMLEVAQRKHGPVHAVFYLGDGVSDFQRIESKLREKNPGVLLYAVKGNNDFTIDEPFTRVVNFGGMRIFMTHGQKFGVKSSMISLELAAREAGCDIVLYGHTHCPDDDTAGRVRMINPGAAQDRRMALMEIVDGKCTVTKLSY